MCLLRLKGELPTDCSKWCHIHFVGEIDEWDVVVVCGHTGDALVELLMSHTAVDVDDVGGTAIGAVARRNRRVGVTIITTAVMSKVSGSI